MSVAQLRVVQAGPLVSIQDAGRFGHLRYGVSAAGPMDRVSFAAANASLEQEAGHRAIEVSLGGLSLECVSGAVSLAITGGHFTLVHQGETRTGWHVITVEQGQSISLRGGDWGSWAYVSIAGRLDALTWLGSAATASMTNFGGGALEIGQILTVQNARVLPAREGPVALPPVPRALDNVRVTLGPQDQHFSQDKIKAFSESSFTVSGAYDRMGMRLDGPALTPDAALSIPSEPILRGSVQVAGDGKATILLADHGTTGGYPKIATVLAEDQDRLVQLRAGDPVRFAVVSPKEALQISRDEARQRQAYLAELAAPRASLSEKLMRENLVDGVVSETPD